MLLFYIVFQHSLCYTEDAALLQSGNREEVFPMEAISAITNFLVAVGANVAAYYICKWLDDHTKGK